MNNLVSHRGVSRILGSNFRFIDVTHTLLGSPSFMGGVGRSGRTHYSYKRDGCYVTHVCSVRVTYRGRVRGLPGDVIGRVRGLRCGW